MHDAAYLDDFTNGVLICMSWEPQEQARRPPRHASWRHDTHEVPPSRGVIDKRLCIALVLQDMTKTLLLLLDIFYPALEVCSKCQATHRINSISESF